MKHPTSIMFCARCTFLDPRSAPPCWTIGADVDLISVCHIDHDGDDRVLVSPPTDSAGEWEIRDIKVVQIISPSILRHMYAARGRRVVARKIRQMRRRFRRSFDPAYRHYER